MPSRVAHDDLSGGTGGIMNAGHQLALTCKDCGFRETFFAPMRSMLIMTLDRSMWHSETEVVGTYTCVDCHGTIQFEKEQREMAAARKRKRAS